MNRQTIAVVGGASVLSLAVGSVMGYFFAKKKLQAEFEERLDQELDDAEQHYKKIYKAEPQYATPQAAAEALQIFDEVKAATKLARQYQGTDDSEADETPLPEERHNVFQEALPVRTTSAAAWDEEVRNRDTSKPYVLLDEEYMLDEMGYNQVVLEWYRNDAVLVDERENIIHESEVDRMVGLMNLKRFGNWSNNPRMVYIRNHQLNLEFEIHLKEGSYAVDVLGLDPPQIRQRPNPPNLPARERFERGARVGGVVSSSDGDDE